MTKDTKTAKASKSSTIIQAGQVIHAENVVINQVASPGVVVAENLPDASSQRQPVENIATDITTPTEAIESKQDVPVAPEPKSAPKQKAAKSVRKPKEPKPVREPKISKPARKPKAQKPHKPKRAEQSVEPETKKRKIKWRYVFLAVIGIILVAFVPKAVFSNSNKPPVSNPSSGLSPNNGVTATKNVIPNGEIEKHLKTGNPVDGTIMITGFESGYTVKNLIISDDFIYPVTGIGSSAFSGEEIHTVALPASLKNIGSSAFEACKFLTTVTFNERLESIASQAFYSCERLKELELPKGLKTIGDRAFSNCINLESVNMPDSVTQIGKDAFSGCAKLNAIYLPDSLKSVEASTFSGCSNLETITIPASVKSIGDSAFRKCRNLTKIMIYSGVKTIGSYAFSDCDNLKELWLPATIEEIVGTITFGSNNLSVIYVQRGSYAEKWCNNQGLTLKMKSVPPKEWPG